MSLINLSAIDLGIAAVLVVLLALLGLYRRDYVRGTRR